jgi:hypothetical protein
VAVDAGAHTTSVAPADVAADGHVGSLMGGAAAGNVGADDVIDAVDILDDTIVADVPPRVADVLNHSGERGGVRTRARVCADSHVVTRPRLPRQHLLSSPVRSRPRTRLQRQGQKSTLFRPFALAAHSHDDSEYLLDQAILRAQQEGQSFPYTVLTRSGESPLPMVRGYVKQLWVDRATRHPLWFATLVQIRALQARVDDLSVGAYQSPRPIRKSHFAGAAVLQPTSLDVRQKKRGRYLFQRIIYKRYVDHTPMHGTTACSAS